MISNDNDFGISGAEAAPEGSPNKWKLIPKIQPSTGKQDDGEYLEINMSVATGEDEHRDGHDQRERSALSPEANLT